MVSEMFQMLITHAQYAWLPMVAAGVAGLAMTSVLVVGPRIRPDWFYATMVAIHCISGGVIFYQARELPWVSQMLCIIAWVGAPLIYNLLCTLTAILGSVVRLVKALVTESGPVWEALSDTYRNVERKLLGGK